MSALATPVLDDVAAHGLGYTVRVSTATGHDLAGLLVDGGRRVLTTALAHDGLRITPAFPDVAPVPGEWPAPAAGKQRNGAAVALLDVSVQQPPYDSPKRITPVKRGRGLAPVRTVAGVPTWARVAVLGPVPRESNRTTTAVYLATLSGVTAPPPPGTPVFRLEDGACIGLLVPSICITTPLSAPMCVVAAVTEDSIGGT